MQGVKDKQFLMVSISTHKLMAKIKLCNSLPIKSLTNGRDTQLIVSSEPSLGKLHTPLHQNHLPTTPPSHSTSEFQQNHYTNVNTNFKSNYGRWEGAKN